jgi:glycosyltransferase involved in cell wall biosynthesis
LTLHNYRLFCAAGIPQRDGKTCTLCLDRKSAWSALGFGCYRGSRLATLPLATGIGLHRLLNTWQREVDAFIALSAFQRDLMVAAGLPAEKVHVKSNFVPAPREIISQAAREPRVVYVGRLGEEKGLRTLVEAWRQWGAAAPELRLIGDGPMRGALEEAARDLPITFCGQLARDAVDEQISRARLLVLPSECIEGVPLSLLEALAHGTPAVVSDEGPLPGLVGDAGVTFTAGDSKALLECLQAVWQNPAQQKLLGDNARRRFEAHHAEQENANALLAIYAAAQVQSANRKSQSKLT